MSEASVALASEADVRSLARRRRYDETGMRFALELAEHGTVWVARDRDEAIAWAAARIDGDAVLIGDLFVETGFRGAGVAGRLLDAVFAHAPDASRALWLDPADPAGVALAVGSKMTTIAPVAQLNGAIPREDALLKMAAQSDRFDVSPLDVVRDGYALDALDRETLGIDRPDVHRALSVGGNGLGFSHRGEMAGYAYVWPDGRIGPVAAFAAGYLPGIVAFSIAALKRELGASWCSLLVPTANARLLRAALRAGLRIESLRALACEVPPPDLGRYAGLHPLRF